MTFTSAAAPVVFHSVRDALPATHGYDATIDVRSPAEYAQDHIPGSVNMPVLDDDERARVGCVYKQQGAFEARRMGAALVARNAARHIEGPLANHGKSWRPMIYCWRGGQRSGAFATILSQIGWRVGVVAGGYKSWRRVVSDAVQSPVPLAHRVILLDGNTGTAKTEVLRKIAAAGGQVIDLECLARHRGSVFGRHATSAQPSQRFFESSLALALSSLDTTRPLIIEAESPRIGCLHLPSALKSAMRSAPRIEISAPLISRANWLVEAYSDIVTDRSRLLLTLDLLRPLHPAVLVSNWRCMAMDGRHVSLALSLMQHHYDPAYQRARDRSIAPICRLQASTLDADGINDVAERVMQAAEGLAVDA